MSTPEDQIAQLEVAITHLESQRSLLGDAVVDAALSPLQEQLSKIRIGAQPALSAERSLPQTANLQGERKLVTVMFADLSGFTALAETMDPEAVRELMNACFERLVPLVTKYDGTVDKFIGDSIMALFGAPSAHENDPERALRAALEMMTALRVINADFSTDLGLHLGINTGLVIAGGIGTQERQQYSVMGDAVNLAARLEEVSEQGEILVGIDTYRQTVQFFDFEVVEPIQVKGKRQPVAAYRLLGLKPKSEAVRSIIGLHSQLVGRDRELDLLQTAVRALNAGNGGRVAIIGDAGVGKSRLIAETRRSLPANVDWTEARALSYTRHVSYGVVRELIRGLLGVDGDAPAERVSAALQTSIQQLRGPFPDSGEIYPFLAYLLDLPLDRESEHQVKSLEAEMLQQSMHRAFRDFVHKRAMVRPVALVWEDLHWADPSSLSLLESLSPLTDKVPLLLALVLRPNQDLVQNVLQRFAARGDEVSTIELAPLTHDQSEKLIYALLQGVDLPTQMQHMLLDRAEGNPFFLEELLRSLLDAGLLPKKSNAVATAHALRELETVDIPDTVQGVIAARIDRLPVRDKQLLQWASVAGRIFDRRVIARVLAQQGPERDLDASLEELQLREFIHPWYGETPASTTASLEEYIFKHALTHETAYNSLLMTTRKALHMLVGEALEGLFPERREEMAAVLAYHFTEAEAGERALPCRLQAGDQAFKFFAIREAIDHYEQARKLTDLVPVRSVNPAMLRHLYLQLGRVYELDGEYERALVVYTELEELARERGDRPLELDALMARTTIYATPTQFYDPDSVDILTQRTLPLARELQDHEAEAKIFWSLMLLNSFAGESSQAVRDGEASLTIARAYDLRERLAYALHELSSTYISAGVPEQGLACAQEAQELWRELGDQAMLVDNLVVEAAIRFILGHYARCLALCEEALQLSEDIGNAWNQSWSQFVMCYVYFDMADFSRLFSTAEISIRLGKQAGFVLPEAVLPMLSGWAYGLLGNVRRGLELADEALASASKIHDSFRAAPLATLAYLHILDGNMSKAESAMQEALALYDSAAFPPGPSLVALAAGEFALAQRQYTRAVELTNGYLQTQRERSISPFVADLLYIKGRALLAQNQVAKARTVLKDAQRQAESLGSQRTLWQILSLLSEIEDPRAAVPLHEQAVQIVEAIANRLTGAELRKSFLATPSVQSVLNKADKP